MPRRAQPLLDVEDLDVVFRTGHGRIHAVRGLSFSVGRGQVVALVGESGSGKSAAAHAIVGLTPGADVRGAAIFEGENLLAMTERSLRAVRGARIGMVFQDPLASFHPAYRVGWQIAEALRCHRRVSKAEARASAVELLRMVGIDEAERRIDKYPHEYSGGMRQRAMVAMAVALDPVLLIADEPTTALDTMAQAHMLELLQRLSTDLGTAILLITHDLRVVAEIADSVVVMYGGLAMETALPRDLLNDPRHPYTAGLLASLPDETSNDRLTPIRGQPASAANPPSGCPFHPRCDHVFDRCRSEIPVLTAPDGRPTRLVACWLSDQDLGRQHPTPHLAEGGT
jgi:oligopeptide/dipeptide ABC transporter ATP-binding protein